jgi:tetratricopeptide (TPR) repeat protein
MRTGSDAPRARKIVASGDAKSLLLSVDDPNREVLGYPVQTIDQLAVRRLLTSRSFDQLDTLLSAYSDSAGRDYRMEYRLFDAYDAFDVAIPSLKPLFDEWVDQHPQSAPARLARGTYLAARAWKARGAKESNETSRAQFREMDAFFARASADFYFGMRLDPRSIVPYDGLMGIAMNEPDHAMGRLLLDRGLKLQPYSFILRLAYMWSLLPRWGGSYAAMEEFARESAPFAARNPRIKALAGYEDWDRGRVLEEKKDYAGAEAAFTRALAAGDASQFRLDRGDFYWRREKFREAFEDLNRALLQRPQHSRGLYERSKVAYHLGFHGSGEERMSMFTQAYDDAELSVALDPTDEYHQEHLEFIRKNLRAYAPPPRQ